MVNTYLTNIGPDLARNIQQKRNNIPQPMPLPTSNIEPKLILHQPTPQNISHWVKKKVFKLSGFPQIASSVWKRLFTSEPVLLCHMIETIFNTFIFPQK